MTRRDPEHSARYKQYVASLAWARKKRECFTRHGRACQACRATEALHVHHMSYEHLGAEPLEDLVCLCEACHGLVHALHDAHGGDLRAVTERFISDARRVGTDQIGTLAPAGRKKPRPKQSSRTVRYGNRSVPACRASQDTCRYPAPSGSGFCWKHDPALGAPDTGAGVPLARVTAASQRDAAVRKRLGLDKR